MVDTNVSLAVLVALLAAADLILVAGLMSNRVAAVAIAVVRRPGGWVGSTAGLVLTTTVAVARRP
jgi:hypothetical protein